MSCVLWKKLWVVYYEEHFPLISLTQLPLSVQNEHAYHFTYSTVCSSSSGTSCSSTNRSNFCICNCSLSGTANRWKLFITQTWKGPLRNTMHRNFFKAFIKKKSCQGFTGVFWSGLINLFKYNILFNYFFLYNWNLVMWWQEY